MSVGNLLADGVTEWWPVRSTGHIHANLSGTFGGGTASLEKLVDGKIFPVYDLITPIDVTVPEDMELSIGTEISIRINLAGATAPDITWSFSAVGS